MKKYLSASIMCADLLNLEASIKELEKSIMLLENDIEKDKNQIKFTFYFYI